MARKAIIERDKKRERMYEQYKDRRADLLRIANDQSRSLEDKMDARRKLHLLPRNSSPTRKHNRCFVTGRPKAYMRYFGVCRIVFREQALLGNLPGVRKGNL